MSDFIMQVNVFTMMLVKISGYFYTVYNICYKINGIPINPV